MIKIKRIKANIDVKDRIGRFGFDYEIGDGLNIICGDNSSGKSTILSCVYYCLGMEQLLGGSREKILDKSLRTAFSIESNKYTVIYSEALIEIENDLGHRALIKRVIKGRAHEDTNSLTVEQSIDGEKSTKTYYVHSAGDHDNESGFYNWLKLFTSIKLPLILQDDGSKVKSLYLQNVMSCALVEQTKGWSDLFSQMPYFGIKDPKTKVVEFLLDLKSLENDIKRDLLDQDKKEFKKNWTSVLENFNLYMSRFSIQLDGLSEKYDSKITSNSINRAKLYLIDGDDSIVLDEKIKCTKKQLLPLSKKLGSKKESYSEINTEKQTDLIKSIRSLNKQLRELENKKITEKYKVEDYKKLVESNRYNIEQISGIRKVKRINDLKKINNCPACNSELSQESRLHIKEDKVDFNKSIAFLRSQQDLYQSYIKSSNALFEKLDNAILYYKGLLKDRELQLNFLKKDISEVESISREKIYQEIKLNKNLQDYELAKKELTLLKEKLNSIFDGIADIDSKLSDLDLNEEQDNQQIAAFSATFRRYLAQFEYSSNDVTNAIIKSDYPAKLMPFIEIERFNQANEVQPIRLNSSASDFIRAEWAYYFALLKSSKVHPGFLVFDEPGQHAMKPSSMQELISASVLSNKQVILAISKSLGKKDKFKDGKLISMESDYIASITSKVERGKVKIIDIDPMNKLKCIKSIE
ncbi:hypothetical protein NB520_08890 [Vibrio antiquarius]|uniref:hypothetical protein n=1 Tax=Vibrio antiquarius (strain Ex25) TaxID=150340 RepID=UPI002657F3ED|nr:hypothetical protein [Vibrio antiquarius]MCR9628009.1 hypothetical protein [Vibrio antiquarius]MCR9631629.1 hypothetical protein [Vibrio antiquarius]